MSWTSSHAVVLPSLVTSYVSCMVILKHPCFLEAINRFNRWNLQQKRYLKDLVVEMWWKNLFEDGLFHLSHSVLETMTTPLFSIRCQVKIPPETWRPWLAYWWRLRPRNIKKKRVLGVVIAYIFLHVFSPGLRRIGTNLEVSLIVLFHHIFVLMQGFFAHVFLQA